MIRSSAETCSSEALSETTIPTLRFPAEMLEGNSFTSATSTPERSVPSRLPRSMWKMPAPRQLSPGPVGFPSTGQGHTSLQWQLAAYVPDRFQGIAFLLPGGARPPSTGPPAPALHADGPVMDGLGPTVPRRASSVKAPPRPACPREQADLRRPAQVLGA